MSKLGQWIDPTKVVRNGGRRLMATDRGIRNECMALDTLDAVLVNMGEPAIYRFRNDPVPTEQGFCINLFNNAWGTNFPMWYDQDASFRFRLQF